MKDNHQKYFQELGKNLQNLRKTKGLSQQELANRCDVDRSLVDKLNCFDQPKQFSFGLVIRMR